MRRATRIVKLTSPCPPNPHKTTAQGQGQPGQGRRRRGDLGGHARRARDRGRRRHGPPGRVRVEPDGQDLPQGLVRALAAEVSSSLSAACLLQSQVFFCLYASISLYPSLTAFELACVRIHSLAPAWAVYVRGVR